MDSDTDPSPDPRRADMQPADKLPLTHRTPFSVEDILDPTKFTKRRGCAEDAETTGERHKLQMVADLEK